MKFKELYKTIEKNKYYAFSLEDILTFYPDEDRASVKEMLYRWKKKGWLYPLKRGFYELTYPKDFNIPDVYIANLLYSPSYVSLETALSHYSIIPEVSMAVTSITTKPTRRFKNQHGLFVYHAVKPVAFTGYCIEKHQSFNVLIAEPEKALVDYLYFKTYRGKKINLGEERLDIGIISQLNKKKIKKYANLYNLDLKKHYAYI